MEALIQGAIVAIQGNEYTLRTSSSIEQQVCSTSKTIHNGWPKVGDRVLIQLNAEQEALVMTRYWCSRSQAA